MTPRRTGRCHDPRRDLGARVCFGLWGPRAARHPGQRHPRRRVGRRVPVPDRSRDRASARYRSLALRVTYVGELGWELYAPTDYGRGALVDALGRRVASIGLVAAGYRAIEALRIEKGYRVWSSDITPDETPFDAGLGFAVALDKTPSARAHDALVAARRRADPPPALPRAGRPAGRRPRQRAGPGRRRDRRAGDERWLRLRGRALDRVRLSAA